MYYSYVEIEYVSPARTDLALKLLKILLQGNTYFHLLSIKKYLTIYDRFNLFKIEIICSVNAL
jgi:hypothetical protein